MKLGGKMEIIALGQKKKKRQVCIAQPILQMPEREFPKKSGRAHLRGLKGETQEQEEEMMESWHAGK